MIYETCGHYEGKCPCLQCNDCDGCFSHPGGGVDTVKLCERARIYCESGRGNNADHNVLSISGTDS